MSPRAALFLVLALALALGAPACASSPPDRFYALPSPTASAGQAAGATRLVLVTQAVVPEAVDRPQLVLQDGEQRLIILEQHRWAEPLRTGVARVIAAELERRLPGTRVATRQDAIGRPDCLVNLDVRRLEAKLGVEVIVDTLWSVACAGAAPRTGHSLVRERLAGRHPDAVVTATGQAVIRVGGEIARAW